MTPRENMLRVLSGGNPDWMPVCVHFANSNNLPGYLPRELMTEPLDRLRISEYLGGDILYETHGVRSRMTGGCRIDSVTGEDGGRSTITTPYGMLEEEKMFSRIPTPEYKNIPPDHVLPGPIVSSTYTRFFLQSSDDYRVLKAYFDAQRFTADHAHLAREIQRVGDRGIVVLGGGPSSPLYAMAARYAGIERFVYDLTDFTPDVEAVMNAIQAAACRWYEAAAATDCDVIRCSDDCDVKFISPDLFHRYAAPALKEYARICHACGKLLVVHMCGHIRDFLPDLRDAGVDAIHCLTEPPMGNTSIADARRVLAGHTAAMLRFDSHLLLRSSGDQIDEAIIKTCRETEDWHNVLMMIAPGRAPLDNIRRVIEQVRRYGQWR